jgi:hypothetical protein
MTRALTSRSVETMKLPAAGRMEVPDGILLGLYFVLQPTGGRSWAVRYRYQGRPRKLTLGSYPAIELGAARALARQALQLAAAGRDPAGEKKEQRRAAQAAHPDRNTVAYQIAEYMERYARKNTRPHRRRHGEAASTACDPDIG